MGTPPPDDATESGPSRSRASVLTTARVWADAAATPGILQTTLTGLDGRTDAAEILGGARRIIATGNGASFHAAHAFAIATLSSEAGPDVVALPTGVISAGALTWRPGDVLFALSSSGELRDLADLMETLPEAVTTVLVTGSPTSLLAGLASCVVLVAPGPSTAITHTHHYCGAVLASLATWALVVNDDELRRACQTAPSAFAAAVEVARAWHDESATQLATPSAIFVAGAGNAWSAALQAALLIKEIARIPCEGVEAREVATTAMTAMAPGHLLLTLPTSVGTFLDECEAIASGRGAAVTRAPSFPEAVDHRLASLIQFPVGLALAVELAARRGLDADRPDWAPTYFATARRSSEADL
jgi:glutamine---fructose-6-phosphate transaminase (isomerizing)